MKRVLLNMLLLASGLLAGGEFVFRPLFPEGMAFYSEIQLSGETKFQLVTPGSNLPLVRDNRFQIVFFGNIRLEKVSPSGQWERLLLEIDHASGSVNGHILDSSLLSGKRVRALARNGNPLFLLQNGPPVTGRAREYLLLLFSGKGTRLGLPDLFGPSCRFSKAGDVWHPSRKPVQEELKKRGIDSYKVKLAGFAQYEGRKKLGKVPCLSFRTEITTPDAKGYDLRFRLRVILPEDPAVRDAGKIERQTVEILERKLLAGDPAVSGSSVRLVTVEKTVFLIQPYQARKEQNSSFLDRLLR